MTNITTNKQLVEAGLPEFQHSNDYDFEYIGLGHERKEQGFGDISEYAYYYPELGSAWVIMKQFGHPIVDGHAHYLILTKRSKTKLNSAIEVLKLVRDQLNEKHMSYNEDLGLDEIADTIQETLITIE